MSAATIRIESTAGCGAVTVLLFAAAELDLSVHVHVRDDGAFRDEPGGAGPALIHGGELTVGMRPSLARLASRFAPALALEPMLAGSFGTIGPRLRDWLGARDDGKSRGALEHALDGAEHELGERSWLLGEPTAADALVVCLPWLAALGLELEARWPRLAALARRLVTRPAYTRAIAQRAAIAGVGVTEPNELLQWWTVEAPALAPARRDDEIRARFGPTIDRARAGRLDAWAHAPQGPRALELVLGPLACAAFRDHPPRPPAEHV